MSGGLTCMPYVHGMQTTATLHDGSTIDIEVQGDGPNLLLPVNPIPIEGPQAEAMRQWGADPALGRTLIDGLSDVARVVAFDYEGRLLAQPMPETLTPANVVADVLAVADAGSADRFAWYGYSWLAMVGLQLALATDRLTALAMGGYPPIEGPYDEMHSRHNRRLGTRDGCANVGRRGRVGVGVPGARPEPPVPDPLPGAAGFRRPRRAARNPARRRAPLPRRLEGRDPVRADLG